MKKVFKFVIRNLSMFIYLILCVVYLCINEKSIALVFATLFSWSLSDYLHEKINKEYTDYLEQDRDKWYKKYLAEKYGNKETGIEITNCKN